MALAAHVLSLRTCKDARQIIFFGLLNSKLATFQLKAVCPPKLNNYIEFSARAITSFPVRAIDFSNSSDKARHDRMVELVEQMLAARKQLAGAQSDKDKDFYTNRSDSWIARLIRWFMSFTGCPRKKSKSWKAKINFRLDSLCPMRRSKLSELWA